MSDVSRKIAFKVLYWNIVAAVIVLGLAGVAYLQRAHQFDRIIVREARAHGLDPRLVSAVIWRESKFVPGQTGKAGEIGLMQVGEAAAGEWAEATGRADFEHYDLYHPEANIQAGVWYLARAVRHWSEQVRDPLPYALAEYNAGRSNARRWAEGAADAREFVENITYPTTQRYVRTVLERFRGGV